MYTSLEYQIRSAVAPLFPAYSYTCFRSALDFEPDFGTTLKVVDLLSGFRGWSRQWVCILNRNLKGLKPSPRLNRLKRICPIGVNLIAREKYKRRRSERVSAYNAILSMAADISYQNFGCWKKRNFNTHSSYKFLCPERASFLNKFGESCIFLQSFFLMNLVFAEERYILCNAIAVETMLLPPMSEKSPKAFDQCLNTGFLPGSLRVCAITQGVFTSHTICT